VTTLAALATPLDLAKRGITLSPGEADLAATYLDIATAAVRQAAGVPISQATSVVELEGSCDQWLRPPGVPVTAVSAVSVDGVTVTDWVLRSGQLWRARGWSDWFTPSSVIVSYTHGLPNVPADIVDLVCRMAAAALVAFRGSPDGAGLASSGNVRQETLADYSVTYSASGQITEMILPDSIRDQLAARFGNSVAVVGSR
jgi:hypothetical protein